MIFVIPSQICVKDGSGNPFWDYQSRKDCNGQPDPQGNALL